MSTTPLESRHRRTVVGILLMLIGVGFAVPAALQILHGAPAPTSVIGLAHQYGFPVLLLLAGYQLYDRDSFDDVVDKVKSILPGKS